MTRCQDLKSLVIGVHIGEILAEFVDIRGKVSVTPNKRIWRKAVCRHGNVLCVFLLLQSICVKPVSALGGASKISMKLLDSVAVYITTCATAFDFHIVSGHIRARRLELAVVEGSPTEAEPSGPKAENVSTSASGANGLTSLAPSLTSPHSSSSQSLFHPAPPKHPHSLFPSRL